MWVGNKRDFSGVRQEKKDWPATDSNTGDIKQSWMKDKWRLRLISKYYFYKSLQF